MYCINKSLNTALAVILVIGMVMSGLPSGISFAADLSTVYAAAYKDAESTDETTLPAAVDVDGTAENVTWSWKKNTFYVPYDTVSVTGTTGSGKTVTAQVEVLPPAENELVYFIDASRDIGKESKAFDSVKALASALQNDTADQEYDSTDQWGRTGLNFRLKGTSGLDETNKFQTGWYSSSKTEALNYQYYLEAGTYTLTAGFYEWWNGRSMRLELSGDGMSSVTSQTATVSGAGSTAVQSVSFTVDTACMVTMAVQNATGGEAPVISWFAVAKGNVEIPEKPILPEIVINGSDVEAAAANQNGLTYKGFGLLSGNSTSNLLMDYKEEAPDAYQEMLEVLFGGTHPLMNHIKMEMGNDGNNSTGADSCTMRFADEEADASRSPGFQLAADAKKINPNIKVSILRWEMPAWVSSAWNSDKTGAGYEAMYKWYSETIFDCYEKYGYILDYVNPDKNETWDPDEDFIKWFKNRLVNESDFPAYMDAAAQEAYHNIKIIASDENTSLNIVPSMRQDTELYNAVDAVGFHYRAGDEASTADYRTLADVDDKEVWYSEGCATFSYTEYQENKTTEYGGGTIGGYQSPLALADNFIKSFVYSRKSHYIFQPAIGSFYEGSQYDHKEILSAREPWAGYVHYDPVIYMLEHFSKYAVTGWENEDNSAGIWRVIPNACGNNSSGSDHLQNQSGNPSYMTLAAPDKSNFSVIIVNNSNKTLTYTITAVDMNLAQGAPMEIWETKTDSYLTYQGEADYADGYYTVTVNPYSMVTATTLDCNGKEEYTNRLPAERTKTVLDTGAAGKTQDTANEILYADDFNYSGYAADYLESRGNEPRYFVDYSGAFEVENGQLKQSLSQSIEQWHGNTPNTVAGDFRWMNYKAKVDVTIPGSGYAGLNIREQTGMNFEGSGYNLQIKKDGSWTLKKRGTTLDSGTVTQDSNGSYHLALEGKGALITAWINEEKVASYLDSNPEYFGRIRLGCDWQETYFDNLTVEKVAGYVPYASAMIDNASDQVSYEGAWNIIAGGGGSSNDWYRSTSTTSSAGAKFTFGMMGAGFALIGANDGSGVLDVEVDGVTIAENTATNSSSQHCSAYMITGMKNSVHQVTVTVQSGTFILDGIYFIPYSEADKTELIAEIEKAELIENTGYTQDSWSAFQDAVHAAKAVQADENASQEQIDEAYYTLLEAVDGLLTTDSVKEAEAVSAASYAGKKLVLPESITCTTVGGDTVEKEVIWDTDGLDNPESYKKLTVNGTIKDDGFEVSADVEIVPQGLVWFIDSGIDVNTQTTTKPYEVIKKLIPGLKNDKADQAYTDGSTTWGYHTDLASIKGQSSIDMTDKTASGLYGNGSGASASPIIYTLPMEAGEYTISLACHEWWWGPRTMNITASWKNAAGEEQTELIGENITVSSSDRDKKVTGKVSLDTDSVMTVTVALASGTEAPVISWLAVAKAEAIQTVDRTALRAAVVSGAAIEGSNYTPESYAAMTAALRTAQTVLADETATQEAVDAAADALTAALNALVVQIQTVDRTALRAAVVSGAAIEGSNYTPESYAAMTAAFSTAQTVLADETATQEAVDAAADALTAALNALVVQIQTVDRTALRAAVVSGAAIEGSNYTPESYAAMTAAFSTAQAVLADETATQEAVDAAADALTAAINSLVIRAQNVDKSALQSVITMAEAVNSNYYSAQSYAAMMTALNNAYVIFINEASTQDEVDAAANTLLSAYHALVYVNHYSESSSALSDVQSKTQEDENANVINLSEEKVKELMEAAGNGEKAQVAIADEKYIDKIKKEEDAEIKIVLNSSEDLFRYEKENPVDFNLSSELLEEAKDSQRDISVVFRDETGKERYSWSFAGKDLVNSDRQITDVSLTLGVEKAEDNEELKELSGSDENEEKIKNGVVLHFAHEGELPAQAAVRIYVGDIINSSDDPVFLYHYNHETGRLEELPYGSDYKVEEDGYITVSIIHCSDYVVLPVMADSKIKTSLGEQITLASEDILLYTGKYKYRTARIKVILPSTLILVDSLEDSAGSSAVGEVSLSYKSDNKKVAEVDDSGKITARAAGSTVVFITAQLSNGEIVTYTVNVTVKKPYISITKKTSVLKNGDKFDFEAVAYGTNLKTVWMTTKKSIVTINKKTGKATAKSKGTDYVKALAGDMMEIVKVTVK